MEKSRYLVILTHLAVLVKSEIQNFSLFTMDHTKLTDSVTLTLREVHCATISALQGD